MYIGGITLTAPLDFTSDHVGNPFTCNEVKLVSVPDMNYLSTDHKHSDGMLCLGRGEVYVRGPNIFLGYYKNPEETSAILDYGELPSHASSHLRSHKDAWLRTGDIGLFTINNQLKLIDRRKNMFKLSQGEYIAIEKLEQIYSGACAMISQLYIHGESNESKLIGVIVLDLDMCKQWLREHPLLPPSPGNKYPIQSSHSITDMKSLQLYIPTIESEILKQFLIVAKQSKLNTYEYIQYVHIDTTSVYIPWSVENDLLTPTMKMKRNKIRDVYLSHIMNIYKSMKTTNNTANGSTSNTFRSKL